jgi:hypothetical protein
MSIRARSFLPALLLIALNATVPAVDAAKKQPKPSIKAMGISINRVYAAKGHEIKADDGTNDCYILGGGPSGVPPQLVAYAYVRTIRIPASAPLELELNTRWYRAPGGALDSVFSGKLKDGLFTAYKRPQAQLYNGPTTKNDRYRYRMLPQPGPTSIYINGTYSISVSVKVGGKTLKSRASVDVTC